MKRIIALILFFSYLPAFGSNTQAGKIYQIEFIGDGRVLFRHTGERTEVPGCVGDNFANRWAFDATTEGGKVLLAGIMMAYAIGKEVYIRGQADDCLVWGDTETVNYFYTKG